MSFTLTANSEILKWLKGAFPVESVKGAEVRFSCPDCSHSSHYFNIKKKVSFCHRASCGAKFTLKALVDLKGYGPDDYYSVSASQEPVAEKPKVELPPGVWEVNDITDPWLVKALEYRGVTIDKLAQFRITALSDRVYIPVYHKGELVQVIGRAIDRSKHPANGFKTDHASRFAYAKGVSITNYIFQWDTVKEWEEVCLVESTFNAMAWIDKFNCTTNFGSHLSKSHISLLAHSKIKRVAFAWDEDSAKKEHAAAKCLEKEGIQTARITFPWPANQPDDIPFEHLHNLVQKTFSLMKERPNNYGPLIVGDRT